jgi:hypothetical protein
MRAKVASCCQGRAPTGHGQLTIQGHSESAETQGLTMEQYWDQHGQLIMLKQLTLMHYCCSRKRAMRAGRSRTESRWANVLPACPPCGLQSTQRNWVILPGPTSKIESSTSFRFTVK